MSRFPDNLLNEYARDIEQAITPNNNYTPEAQQQQRQSLLARARDKYYDRARTMKNDALVLIDHDRVKQTIGVDWENPTASTMIGVKWEQVTKLRDQGQSWAQIIDNADLAMIATIVDYTPSHIAPDMQHAHVTPNQRLSPAKLDNLEQFQEALLRRAAALGSRPGKTYLQEVADRAYNGYIGEKISTQLSNDDPNPLEISYWKRAAETIAAVILGEPTPDEQEQARRDAEAKRASDESRRLTPSELADHIRNRQPIN